MKDFYISSIGASGPGVATSEVELQNGVNIIHGPSNTGKSMVLDCVDYMLGASEAPLNPADTKYDTVFMRLTNSNGETLLLERKVRTDNGSGKSDSKIHIESSYPEIPTGDYSTSSQGAFNNEILKLLGIDSHVQIIRTQEGAPQSLTLRSFLHQFFLKEDKIFTKGTILDNPKHPAITSSLTALMYLIDERGTVEGDFESTQVKKAKKKAVTDYISKKFKYIEDRNRELESMLDLKDGADPESKMQEIRQEISETQQSIYAADRECRNLMADILKESEGIQEAQFLQDRYTMLRSQYESDLQRLEFIVDGEANSSGGYADSCPFCSHEIDAVEKRESYADAAGAELRKVSSQLRELMETQKEIDSRIEEHKKNLAHLRGKHDGMQALIDGSLKPHMDELSETLERYREVSRIKTELQVNQSMYDVFNFDYNYEEAKETKADKFDAKAKFDEDVFARLSVAVSDAIRECGYPGFKYASLSRKDYDVTVNGKDKRDEGKGYRAFLNAIFAFSLMKFLEEEAAHPPMMLFLDSPILSLMEADEEEEAASDNMKNRLFQHIIDHSGECQVVIAENEIPEGKDVHYKNAKLIHFTKDENVGTYGFLKSHR